jgi:thiosulfate/3-mercaptopyruvate sulfurtransferase
MVRALHQVLQNVDSKVEGVVDARGAGRFNGTAPEPRKGIRGGHIPGSVNVPFDSVLEDGR